MINLHGHSLKLYKEHFRKVILVEIVFLVFICTVSLAGEETIIKGTRGQAIVLQCLLNVTITPEWNGPPSYAIYYKREKLNDAVQSIAEGRLKLMHNKKDLIISNVQKSDEGLYQCFEGVGKFYRFHLVVIEPAENDNITPGGNNTGSVTLGRDNTALIIGIALILWISICTVGIFVLWKKYCKCKFLVDIAKQVSFHKPKEILLVLSCYIFIGWIILIYKVLMERQKFAVREENLQAERTNLLEHNGNVSFAMDNDQHRTRDNSIAAVENNTQHEVTPEIHSRASLLPSNDDLFKISKTITCKMELIADPLNILPEQINNIKNKQGDSSCQIYDMLVIWRNTEGCKASHIDIVDKLKPVLKDHINMNTLKTMFDFSQDYKC